MSLDGSQAMHGLTFRICGCVTAMRRHLIYERHLKNILIGMCRKDPCLCVHVGLDI